MKLRRGTFKGDPATQALQLGGVNKLKLERNRSYLFNALQALCMIGLSAAVWRLAEIHTVIPVVSVVDANGHVTKQTVVNKDTITAQDAFVQSEVHAFVTACNTFDPAWRQHYADLCRLHATLAVARQYDTETGPENPDNPYYQLAKGERRYPRITAVTSLAKEAYQVSFQSITDRPGSEPRVEYFTALVHYTFTYKPLALGDRWENPLGFAATAYRKDQELSRQQGALPASQ
ncbi:type IV secretion system protein VirB8 [Cupriavidus basilensis OR16]|uniref:Type IV secretion system protein VirB8 n=1 Tax=Cupriavidus basilensis OR16 TaxID=1127483 RepID=H1RZU9_9BURK|nr:type IV secretion system protein [Cupriavidus basilensis]EHP44165.1 type IV secretion system protein VirB8 [Cupriavidus basilensis OR16]